LKALAPGADFMIAVSADQWELHGIEIGSHQAEAIVNHELRHAGIREGKPVINPHTAVFFVEEIAEYGLFTPMLQAAGTAFQQLAFEQGFADAAQRAPGVGGGEPDAVYRTARSHASGSPLTQTPARVPA
jgi:hypothetical protein